jgi:stage II sporulation protein D
VAERLLREAEDDVGWRLPFRARLQIFSTLDNYRDSTGQPGWVAASTRGQTIRLQPLAELRRRLILEPTLRHELYHLLLETRAARNVPVWFREGLTLHLSSPTVPDAPSSSLGLDEIEQILKHGDTREKMQKAYASAQKIVAGLIQQRGKQAVLAWLSSGLPADVLRSLGGIPATAPRGRANDQPREKPE